VEVIAAGLDSHSFPRSGTRTEPLLLLVMNAAGEATTDGIHVLNTKARACNIPRYRDWAETQIRCASWRSSAPV
jgi:hypothetical protein